MPTSTQKGLILHFSSRRAFTKMDMCRVMAGALRSGKRGKTDEELGLGHLVEDGSVPAEGVIRPKVSPAFLVGRNGVGREGEGNETTRRGVPNARHEADLPPSSLLPFAGHSTQSFVPRRERHRLERGEVLRRVVERVSRTGRTRATSSAGLDRPSNSSLRFRCSFPVEPSSTRKRPPFRGEVRA